MRARSRPAPACGCRTHLLSACYCDAGTRKCNSSASKCCTCAPASSSGWKAYVALTLVHVAILCACLFFALSSVL